MRPGFLQSRIVQVHPTRRCNLSCRHCYSTSGPALRHELSPDRLIARLALLRDEGYEVVSFSGGEPLMYRAFPEVAAACRSFGFRVNLITNGLLLTDRRIESIAGVVSVVGVSIDGRPERHDAMRGQPGVFDRVMGVLPKLRAAGIPFGLSHCVSRESIAELPWLLTLAQEVDAALLQLHPLTLFGRAASECQPDALRPSDLNRVALISALLEVQSGEDGPLIQLDLAPAQTLLASRESYPLLAHSETDPGDQPLAELVNPVVLDEHGALSPLAYGMPRAQQIAAGDIDIWQDSLQAAKRDGMRPLQRLLRAGFAEVERQQATYVDWYGTLVDLAGRLARRGGLPLAVA